mmetsp:Transcript_82592/g.257873  ORF Transcript_82592/g.257873 Transcript_82592/m.257873 type:complete len:85 (-) Transcript_82592:192-446(-)
MTPQSEAGGSSEGSVNSATFAPAAECERGRRRSSVGAPLMAPDGIQILVADTSAVADSGWQGLMEDSWDSDDGVRCSPWRSRGN